MRNSSPMHNSFVRQSGSKLCPRDTCRAGKLFQEQPGEQLVMQVSASWALTWPVQLLLSSHMPSPGRSVVMHTQRAGRRYSCRERQGRSGTCCRVGGVQGDVRGWRVVFTPAALRVRNVPDVQDAYSTSQLLAPIWGLAQLRPCAAHGVCACKACIRTSRSSPDAAYTLLYTFDSGISLHFFGATNRTLRTIACLTHLADAFVPRSGACQCCCSTMPASIRVKTM